MKLSLTFLIMRRASVARIQQYSLYTRNVLSHGLRHGHLTKGPTIWLFRGGGWGYGWFGLRKNFFFPKPLVTAFFSLTQKAIVWQVFPWKIFFRSKSVYSTVFFLNTHTAPLPFQKSNGRPLTDHFSSFWNSVFLCSFTIVMLEAAFAFAWSTVVHFWPSP